MESYVTPSCKGHWEMWLLSGWPFAQLNLGILLQKEKVEEKETIEKEEWEEKEKKEKKKEERIDMGVVVGFRAGMANKGHGIKGEN